MSLENNTNNENSNQEKIYEGAITIFYKEINKEILYLIAENTETENISFVSGAKEDNDKTLEETVARENKEELDLDPEKYNIKRTNVKHEFVFGKKKKERAGCKGEYTVFTSNLSNSGFKISHTEELKSIKWLTEEEVIKSLTFDDVIEVFRRTIETIKNK